MFIAANHLNYLGVEIAWVTGPWFLSIFVNMLPWESGQVSYHTCRKFQIDTPASYTYENILQFFVCGT
jgi:hypothetical protein